MRLHGSPRSGAREIGEELDRLAWRSRSPSKSGVRARVQAIIKPKLSDVKKAFARRARPSSSRQENEVEDEDLIQREDMVVRSRMPATSSACRFGYARSARRQGQAGMHTRDEDFVSRLLWPPT